MFTMLILESVAKLALSLLKNFANKSWKNMNGVVAKRLSETSGVRWHLRNGVQAVKIDDEFVVNGEEQQIFSILFVALFQSFFLLLLLLHLAFLILVIFFFAFKRKKLAKISLRMLFLFNLFVCVHASVWQFGVFPYRQISES